MEKIGQYTPTSDVNDEWDETVPTRFRSGWFNAVQRELVAVVEKVFKKTLNVADDEQIATSLKSRFEAIARSMPFDAANGVEMNAAVGAANDTYGRGVAVSADGSVIVVGADGATSNTGKVYVYSGQDWATETILTASDGAVGDRFGKSVAISADGSVIVVGSYDDDTSRGAVYVYSGSSWATQTRLTAIDGASNHAFGYSVAVSNDGTTVAVGAYGHNSSEGAAYIFNGANWATQTQILASDGLASDNFGYSIAISGDGLVLVVGARADNTAQGAAYVYSGSSWATQTKLTASNGASNHYFGRCVDTNYDGSVVAVGLYTSTVSNVYIFCGENWAAEKILTPSDTLPATVSFGYSVALSDDGRDLLVTAFGDKLDLGVSMGSLYYFTNYGNGNLWKEHSKFYSDRVNTDTVVIDNYGDALALSGNGLVAVVGAWRRDVGANTDQGAAFRFEKLLGA